MARIAGVDLPRDKRVEIGLTYIYGIGRTRSNEILDLVGIDPDKRVRDLTESEISGLRQTIDRQYQVEGDLRREVQQNIRRLKDMVCRFVVSVRAQMRAPGRGRRRQSLVRDADVE
jgi:small subunit ribosomal protein S13